MIKSKQIWASLPKKWWVLALMVIGIVGVPILYLNCAGPMAPSYDESSVAAGAPFAYQMKLDQIAYMSCSNLTDGSYNQNAFFNFMAGAYGANTGLSLNQAFIYDVRNLQNSDQINVLTTGTNNAGLYPELSVRAASSLVSGGVATAGTYYNGQFIGALSTPSIPQTLLQGNGTDWYQSFVVNGVSVPFQSSIVYSGLESNVGSTLRTFVQTGGAYYLAASYGTVGGTTDATPTGTQSAIYGNGYRFSFGLGTGQTSGVARAVTSMQEFDLTTQTPTAATWSCKNYMIVYPGDLGVRKICNAVTNPSVTGQQATDLLHLREMLPAAYWSVDMTNNCVVPQALVTGQFCNGNLTLPSTTASTTAYTGTCSSVTPDTCPHFVSICNRTSN